MRGNKARTDGALVTLVTLALVANFLWFETAERTALLAMPDVEGRDTWFLTCFLMGMAVTGAAGMAGGRRLDALWPRIAPACGILGCLASVALVGMDPAGPLRPLVAAAMALTGIANVALLMAETVVMAHIGDRRIMSVAVLATFAGRTGLLACVDLAGSTTLTHALVVLLPVTCAMLTLAAGRRVSDADRKLFDTRTHLAQPASTTMMTLLVLGSLMYAVTANAVGFDYWQPGLFVEMGPAALAGGILAFCAAAYITLVATRADFLTRFLPALFVLLAANVVLVALDTQDQTRTILGMGTNMLSEAFSWLLMLYAIRLLKTPPLRAVGTFMCVEAGSEALLYALGPQVGASRLAVILCFVLVVLLMLTWNMHQLYAMAERMGASPCESCPLKTTTPDVAPSVDETPQDRRVALAAARGLSRRETDVFMLLAQGYSRQYISDELFISPGTTSTHTSRIYEKFGVHSKQELLALVNK